MNIEELKVQLILHKKKNADLAETLGISKSALYRKMNKKSDFTRLEIVLIKEFLNLDNEKINEIFFNQKVS